MTEIVSLTNSEQIQIPEIYFIEKMGINLTRESIKQFLLALKEPESKEFVRIGVRGRRLFSDSNIY